MEMKFFFIYTLGWFVMIFLEVRRIFLFLLLIWLIILQLHLQASSTIHSDNNVKMLKISNGNDKLQLYPWF